MFVKISHRKKDRREDRESNLILLLLHQMRVRLQLLQHIPMVQIISHKFKAEVSSHSASNLTATLNFDKAAPVTSSHTIQTDLSTSPPPNVSTHCSRFQPLRSSC